MPTKKHHSSIGRRNLILIVCMLLIIGAVAFAATIHLKGSTATNSQKTGVSSRDTGANTTTPTSTKSNGTKTPSSSPSSGSATANLIAPSGSFVSNHHPNLSGTPAPNTMQSVCTTTPGAVCAISFTNNGVTKSLTPQTADKDGNSYWSWKLQDIELSSGSWHIEAVATLGSQSLNSADVMNLEVAP